LLLALIVWWTMFSGRDGGELQQDNSPDTAPHPDDAPPGDASTRPPAQVRPTDSNTS
jgi:hypothetical protein